ncbi:hypothetical protein T484DRAFT_1984845, partial [Baffinella frigidus]
MTRHLTNIITKAMLEKDASLTKKVCRERMEVVFGEQVEENKTFVNEEVGRIMAASRDLSEPELGAQLDSYVAVLSEEVEGVRAADVRASEAPTPNKLDALYRSLHTSMVVLPESDAAVARIKEMVSGSHAAGHDDHSLVVEKVFEIKLSPEACGGRRTGATRCSGRARRATTLWTRVCLSTRPRLPLPPHPPCNASSARPAGRSEEKAAPLPSISTFSTITPRRGRGTWCRWQPPSKPSKP